MPALTSPIARIAIVWCAMLALFLGITQSMTLLFGPDYAVGRHLVSAVLTTALTVPLIVLARRHLDREPFARLGLALDRSALKPLLVGMLAWLLPFAMALAVCIAFGLVSIRATARIGDIAAFLPVLVLLVLLLEALPEELAFRGYMQTNLGRLFQPWLAVTLQAALFGSWGVALWLITSGGIDPMQASLFYVMGGVLGMLRVVTRSVWASIGFHLAFQTVAQLLMHGPRAHFEIEGVFWLQFIALGAVPFALALPLVECVYRDRVDWNAPPAAG